jgi:hypothetical protein
MLPAEMKRNDVCVMPLDLCLCPMQDKTELNSVNAELSARIK